MRTELRRKEKESKEIINKIQIFLPVQLKNDGPVTDDEPEFSEPWFKQAAFH